MMSREHVRCMATKDAVVCMIIYSKCADSALRSIRVNGTPKIQTTRYSKPVLNGDGRLYMSDREHVLRALVAATRTLGVRRRPRSSEKTDA
jgi:hypothetical protein